LGILFRILAKYNLIFAYKYLINELMVAGFGINTNIFETNLLNLAVVVSFVVSAGGNFLSSTLEQRRSNIESVLTNADKKFLEAKQILETANLRLAESKETIAEIEAKSLESAEALKAQIEAGLQKEKDYLTAAQATTFQLEKERSINSLTYQISTLAIEEAKKTIDSGT
jgi:F-type H+-transporting ATPase subunit b